MDTQAFHHWLAQLSQLSAQQRTTLNQALQNLPPSAVLEGLPALQSCQHCKAKTEHLAPWGRLRGLRRYRCRACRRTCSALSAIGLSRLHYPEHWKDYASTD